MHYTMRHHKVFTRLNMCFLFELSLSPSLSLSHCFLSFKFARGRLKLAVGCGIGCSKPFLQDLDHITQCATWYDTRSSLHAQSMCLFLLCSIWVHFLSLPHCILSFNVFRGQVLTLAVALSSSKTTRHNYTPPPRELGLEPKVGKRRWTLFGKMCLQDLGHIIQCITACDALKSSHA